MKELHVYSNIIRGEKIYLGKIDYDKTEKGKPIIVRRSPYSNLFLGIQAELNIE